MPATPAQLRAMKKWRENNKKHYLEKQRGYQKTYYDEHKDEISQHKKEFYEKVLKPRKEAKKANALPETITHVLPETFDQLADLTNLTGPNPPLIEF